MATRDEQRQFVKALYPAALKLYKHGGIHPAFVVAQAAVETGWQIKGISNNIFGITKGSWRGQVQLCLTTEYFNNPNKKFKAPERVVSITPLSGGKYKYGVYRLFRVYDTLEDCLKDHLTILTGAGYADAWIYRDDAKEYARRLIDGTGAKYATASNYSDILCSTIDMVERIVKEDNVCGIL